MRIPGADKAIANLIAWSGRDEWYPLKAQVFADHFDPVLDEFGISVEDAVARLGEGMFAMAYGCVLEDFFTARFGDEDLNVIDDYLKRRGWKEKVFACRYLEALRDSLISLYEVVDLIPGQQMTVKDLIRGGDPITVTEKSGSETAVRWDCIAARVVTVNGQPYFTGGMLLFGRELTDLYLSGVNNLTATAKRQLRSRAKGQTTPLEVPDHLFQLGVLERAPTTFVQMWLSDALKKASRPLPEVRNTEGDEIVFTEVRYPLTASAAEVSRRLDNCAELLRDDPKETRWSWLAGTEPAKKPASQSSKHRSDRLTFETEAEFGIRILGTIELRDQTLFLATNSVQRSQRGQDLLAAQLGDILGRPLTSLQTLDKALEEPPSHDDNLPLPAGDSGEIIRAYMDQHYRQTLDQPVPFFGGKSPRQVVKTKKGKEQAVTWLKQLENGEFRRAAADGQQPYEFSWMWQELGIAHLRG